MTRESYEFIVEHAYNQFFVHESFLHSARSGTTARPVGQGVQGMSTKLQGYVWFQRNDDDEEMSLEVEVKKEKEKEAEQSQEDPHNPMQVDWEEDDISASSPSGEEAAGEERISTGAVLDADALRARDLLQAHALRHVARPDTRNQVSDNGMKRDCHLHQGHFSERSHFEECKCHWKILKITMKKILEGFHVTPVTLAIKLCI